MNWDFWAAGCVIGFGVVVAWFSWIYVTFGAEVLQLNLLYAGFAALIALVMSWR